MRVAGGPSAVLLCPLPQRGEESSLQKLGTGRESRATLASLARDPYK